MTDKEISDRIEKDADEYCKQYLPHVDTTGHWLGFQDGAKSERNKTIAMAIEQIQYLKSCGGNSSHQHAYKKSIDVLESLKL